jgi:hypothetical protein
MLLFIPCPGITPVPAPACPASYRPSSSPPAWCGSAAAAPSRRYSRCTTAPTPSSAAAPAPSLSGSGRETRSSPLAALRRARPRTPRPAVRVAAADRRASAQAVPPRPSGCRSHTPWSLHLQRRRRETVPEPFSYPARRFLHARDRRRHQRLHSSGIRRASGHRRGIRRGIRNASGHRPREWTSDLSSQPRPELGGSPVETRSPTLLWRPVSCCCTAVQQRPDICYVQCTVPAIKAVLCIEIN